MRPRLAGGGSPLITVIAVLLLATACRDGSPRPAATASSPPVATIVATARVSDRIRDLTVDSPAVGSRVDVRLILPPEFDAQPSRRFPVLYLLHGCCDTPESWTRSTDVERLVADAGVLVVMPEGGPAGFYSDWLSGPHWETFHVVELWQILQQRYRAAGARAVAGLSMGGLGALDYAARHPGAFRAAASFSGIVHTRLSAAESDGYVGLVRDQGGDPARLWGDPVTDAAVWAEHNPYDLAGRLRGVPLFISAGDGEPGPLDPPGTAPDSIERSIHAENVAFAGHLRALGVPAHIDLYGAGTHSWPYWQRELHRAWPMLRAALTTP
jgi:S-formylglutathione hydrolase FrmB